MENNERQEVELTSVSNASADQTTETSANANVSDVAAKPANAATDINNLSREQLASLLSSMLDVDKVTSIQKEAEEIKKRFDSLTEQLQSNRREAYRDSHNGSEEGYENFSDNADIDMQTAYSAYRNRLNVEHEANSKAKRSIIEQMGKLLEGEDVNTYNQQFRELIAQWKQIGTVAQADYQDISTKYKQHVDHFFDNLKLNHDMRVLDQKRNYEEKIKLCEEAEALAEKTSAIKSFNEIQRLHSQWKQIGTVPAEVREELWNRFKAATSIVNERFHKYIDENKEREKANYEAKLQLIAQVEEIAKGDLSSAKLIEAAAQQVGEIQEKWRTIGIVPKAVNTEVYTRFRKICDEVYNKRRAFFKEQNATLSANLELKKQLIAEVEALKTENKEWKEIFNKIVELQKKWKTIGPVPYKVSEDIWKKFRSACDYFFEERDKATSAEDEEREKNYELKKAILEELKATTLPEEPDMLFKAVQGFQQRWNGIGPLPGKKREIHQEFMDIVNKLYDKCASDDSSKNIQRFRAKMELIKDSADGQSKLTAERNRLIAKITQLENDVHTLENNIGFFSKSKNSEALKNDFENKIKTAKRNIEQANEKLDIIDAL
ncbi:MAG: DUF349 domain-containing protein [Bacteroidales bacterium]|nr:DUF349 domain-containing protein [Bacteroidales bacterium]